MVVEETSPPLATRKDDTMCPHSPPQANTTISIIELFLEYPSVHSDGTPLKSHQMEQFYKHLKRDSSGIELFEDIC